MLSDLSGFSNKLLLIIKMLTYKIEGNHINDDLRNKLNSDYAIKCIRVYLDHVVEKNDIQNKTFCFLLIHFDQEVL